MAAATFTLNDQGSKVFTNVTPGPYTVTEADPAGVGPGYRLFALACADTDPNGTPSTGDVDTRTATINVDSGETVICEFSNNEAETVVVEKRTIPPGGSGFHILRQHRHAQLLLPGGRRDPHLHQRAPGRLLCPGEY